MRIVVMLSLMLSIVACSPKLAPIEFQRNGMVEFVEEDKNTLTVSSKQVGSTKNAAIYYAERNAVENILFRGIPNSQQENPMIENEEDYRSLALRNLVEGGYQSFLIDSYTEHSSRNNGAYNVLQVVKLDLVAMRKKLEKEGVIRSFGF